MAREIKAKVIIETRKAVLLKLFGRNKEIWTPKSVIAKKPRPNFSTKNFQKFLIRNWFYDWKIKNTRGEKG
jgi:hypothetical protein